MYANTSLDFIDVLLYLLYAASMNTIGYNYYMYCIHPVILVIVFKSFMSRFVTAAEVCVAAFPDMQAGSLRVNMPLFLPPSSATVPR